MPLSFTLPFCSLATATDETALGVIMKNKKTLKQKWNELPKDVQDIIKVIGFIAVVFIVGWFVVNKFIF